jgi:histone H3/H4
MCRIDDEKREYRQVLPLINIRRAQKALGDKRMDTTAQQYILDALC